MIALDTNILARFYVDDPGDPEAATHEVELLRGVLDAHLPFFGIWWLATHRPVEADTRTDAESAVVAP